MKTKQYFTLALAVMITVSLSVSLWAQPPKMKYTTKIPANYNGSQFMCHSGITKYRFPTSWRKS